MVTNCEGNLRLQIMKENVHRDKIFFMEKSKKQRKLTLITISQTLFLNVKFFFGNRLLSYACACSFNFLVSFIPVFMMIAIILVRFLHASPDVIKTVVEFFPSISEYISAEAIANTMLEEIQSTKEVHIFEVILGFFVFWMARRFFATTFDSLQNIFHTHTRRKAAMNQLLTIAVEALLIVIVSMMIFIYMSMRTIADITFIRNILEDIPQISSILNDVIISTFIRQFPNLLIFIALLTLYRLVPGTTPNAILCTISALLCTGTFYVFRLVLHHFLNVSNYNMVYGVLSQIVITLMDIQFFFTFFLFYAQTIYVYQFFNEHLLAELYLLPRMQEVGFFGKKKMILFMRPDYLLAEDAKVITLEKGTVLYRPGDPTEGAYYIVEGQITEERNGFVTTMDKGDFFGEIGCVIRKPRNSTVMASEDSKIIKIDSEEFVSMARKNQKAMRKLISKISSNFSFMDEEAD